MTIKLYSIFFLLLTTLIVKTISDPCLMNGLKCFPDGSIGICCSGFCNQQPRFGHFGYCTPR